MNYIVILRQKTLKGQRFSFMAYALSSRKEWKIMKFSNGCWLQQEGCECFAPMQVYFTKIEADRVTLCAPTIPIRHRGDTLGGINLTLVITSPQEEVIRV